MTDAATIKVGKLRSSTSPNEVVGFTSERPPKHLAAPWTNNVDTFDMVFRPPIAIPVTIWIVKGPFDNQYLHAQEALIRTSIIWRNERMGVDFDHSQTTVIDATTNPGAASHYAFPNGDVGDSVWKPLRDDIGFVPGRLNIYWVDTVNYSTTNGWSNFGAQVVMGSNSGEDLLVHEIGHAFSLTHTNGLPDFDGTGVMVSNSNIRQYITEGQLFRAHMNPSSLLNSVYNARAGELQRNCSLSDDDFFCPSIRKRLWADGVFPAN